MHVLFVYDSISKTFHSGISALSAYLKLHGHTTSLLTIRRDAPLDGFRQSFREQSEKAGLVAVTAMTTQWPRLQQLFPIACGANIGTTVTALLAAMVGNAAGLTIAITHTLFNVTGVLLFYPIPAIRNIPIRIATAMGELVRKSRKYAVAFLLGFFFGLPGIMVLVYRLM